MNKNFSKNLQLAFCFTILSLFFGCHYKRHADKIFYNGKIYVVDNSMAVTQAMVIERGRIKTLGETSDILDEFDAPEKIDLKGKAVYPGFIDGHCHFYGYSTDLLKCDLYGSISFDDVLSRLNDFRSTNTFSWILGRGWDQNDWPGHNFPTKEKLDSMFPDKPAYLMRIDGHAVLCNSAAMRLAAITPETKITGGEIILEGGQLTGLLTDNAIDLVKEKIPPFTNEQIEKSILEGQANCFSAGLTTLDDAGLGKDSIFTLLRMQKEGKLKMKIYAMMSDDPATLKYFFKNGPVKTDRMSVCAIKVYADGALGSRGACLKKEYSDEKGHFGYMLHPKQYFENIADEALEHGFQMCTHAIGDSANKVIVDVYANALTTENHRRWRIEHCQVMDPKERRKLADRAIIPSVQPTHATSDMYWAEERLGKDRMANAYAYLDLDDAAEGAIVFGTDFPVESINPIYTFYAAVARKDLKGYPPGGFQIENKVKRKIALRAMTINAAFSNFEDEEKGSLEEGKAADFVVLTKDIMTIDEEDIPKTKVIYTYINGEKVYERIK